MPKSIIIPANMAEMADMLGRAIPVLTECKASDIADAAGEYLDEASGFEANFDVSVLHGVLRDDIACWQWVSFIESLRRSGEKLVPWGVDNAGMKGFQSVGALGAFVVPSDFGSEPTPPPVEASSDMDTWITPELIEAWCQREEADAAMRAADEEKEVADREWNRACARMRRGEPLPPTTALEAVGDAWQAAYEKRQAIDIEHHILCDKRARATIASYVACMPPEPPSPRGNSSKSTTPALIIPASKPELVRMLRAAILTCTDAGVVAFARGVLDQAVGLPEAFDVAGKLGAALASEGAWVVVSAIEALNRLPPPPPAPPTPEKAASLMRALQDAVAAKEALDPEAEDFKERHRVLAGRATRAFRKAREAGLVEGALPPSGAELDAAGRGVSETGGAVSDRRGAATAALGAAMRRLRAGTSLSGVSGSGAGGAVADVLRGVGRRDGSPFDAVAQGARMGGSLSIINDARRAEDACIDMEARLANLLRAHREHGRRATTRTAETMERATREVTRKRWKVARVSGGRWKVESPCAVGVNDPMHWVLWSMARAAELSMNEGLDYHVGRAIHSMWFQRVRKAALDMGDWCDRVAASPTHDEMREVARLAFASTGEDRLWWCHSWLCRADEGACRRMLPETRAARTGAADDTGAHSASRDEEDDMDMETTKRGKPRAEGSLRRMMRPKPRAPACVPKPFNPREDQDDPMFRYRSRSGDCGVPMLLRDFPNLPQAVVRHVAARNRNGAERAAELRMMSEMRPAGAGDGQ